MSKSTKAKRAARSALERLYRELPAIDCKGLCHTTCGPIPMTKIEEVYLADELGHPLPPFMPEPLVGVEMSCPLLTKGKRCSAHAGRPLICRLFGLVNHHYMTCPHGCRPSRRLTDVQAKELFIKVQEISDRYEESEEP